MDNANKNSVLIVDDDRANIIALTHILSPEYTVYAAKNGRNAIDAAEKYLPDVVLLDVIMPDMDGYEVLSMLKKSDRTKHIPVIFITGLSDSENEEKGLALGAADYISKPLHRSIIQLRVMHQIQLINQLRTIEYLNRNLESALKNAEVANHAKSTFLANMSHEIRTPMNAIVGITEILMQDETLPENVMEGVSKINNSSDLLLGIINDILDMSKIEAGGLELVIEKYELASLINDTVHLNMMRFSNNKPVEFKLQVDENVPAFVIGDPLRIKQILNNLLSNGAKYTHEGEVVLEIKSEPGPYTEEEDLVTLVFTIRDTGLGMTEEEVSKLFDEYTRFNVDANRTTEGTGLGMNITRNLLFMMDGEISVESQPGVGSVFTVHIPQKKVNEEVLGATVAENLRQFRMDLASRIKNRVIVREYMPYGSVLVVDDTESNLYVAKGLLSPYGLTIDTAISGFEAIDIIKSGKVYDIIFMDHMMPKMDGIEAVRIIRDSGYKHPIVALTANALAGQAEIFMANGFDGFIAKPIDMRQTNAVLNKFIRDRYPPEIVEAARRQSAAEKDAAKAQQQQASTLLMESFVRDAEKAIAAMEILPEKRDACEDEDVRMYTINAHAMKSALANIGENELSKKAYELEQSGINRDMAVILSDTPAFLDALRAVVGKVKPKEESADIDEDKAYLREKLLFMQTVCEEYDIEAADKTMAELRQKKWTAGTKKNIDLIGEHLLHGDYEEAAITAKGFAETI